MSNHEQQGSFPRQPRRVVPPVPETPEATTAALERVEAVARGQAVGLLKQSPGWRFFEEVYSTLLREALMEMDSLDGVALYRAQGKKRALIALDNELEEIVKIGKEAEDASKAEENAEG
jgi:hypothetical protein